MFSHRLEDIAPLNSLVNRHLPHWRSVPDFQTQLYPIGRFHCFILKPSQTFLKATHIPWNHKQIHDFIPRSLHPFIFLACELLEAPQSWYKAAKWLDARCQTGFHGNDRKTLTGIGVFGVQKLGKSHIFIGSNFCWIFLIREIVWPIVMWNMRETRCLAIPLTISKILH